jgi:hypothetical protein
MAVSGNGVEVCGQQASSRKGPETKGGGAPQHPEEELVEAVHHLQSFTSVKISRTSSSQSGILQILTAGESINSWEMRDVPA